MSAADERPCIERGEHILTQRHSRVDCPTTMAEYTVVWHIDVSADSPFEAATKARAMQMPPTTATVFQVTDQKNGKIVDIDVALPPPAEPEEQPTREPVPAFTKDVEGKFFGGAYWGEAEYRVVVETMDGTGEKFLLRVEDSSGAEVTEIEFNDTQADRLRDVARTSEEADDEGLGLSREIHWHVGDDRNEVDLDMNFLEELAEWIDTIFDGIDA